MNKQKLVEQLKIHEGYREKVYLDTTGHHTVGVGFNLERSDAELLLKSVGANIRDVLEGKYNLSRDQVEHLLIHDVDRLEQDARKIVMVYDELNDVRQRVVLDMIFNLGPYGFSKFKGTIGHICRGEYADAADHMLKSRWARQVKGRAKRLSEMMKYGEDVYEL